MDSGIAAAEFGFQFADAGFGAGLLPGGAPDYTEKRGLFYSNIGGNASPWIVLTLRHPDAGRDASIL